MSARFSVYKLSIPEVKDWVNNITEDEIQLFVQSHQKYISNNYSVLQEGYNNLHSNKNPTSKASQESRTTDQRIDSLFDSIMPKEEVSEAAQKTQAVDIELEFAKTFEAYKQDTPDIAVPPIFYTVLSILICDKFGNYDNQLNTLKINFDLDLELPEMKVIFGPDYNNFIFANVENPGFLIGHIQLSQIRNFVGQFGTDDFSAISEPLDIYRFAGLQGLEEFEITQLVEKVESIKPGFGFDFQKQESVPNNDDLSIKLQVLYSLFADCALEEKDLVIWVD